MTDKTNKSMDSDPNEITGEERESILENNESGFAWNGMFNPGMKKANN